MRHLLTDLRGNPIYSFAQRLRRKRCHIPTTTTLFALVQNRAWIDVIRRVKRYPHEVLQANKDGHTVLHLACRLDPPVTIIRALSAAASFKNMEGATPLHVAASHRCSAPALQALIEVACEHRGGRQQHPTADLTRMGRAPIHYACMSHRGLNLEAFQVLFESSLKHGVISQDDPLEFEFDDEDDIELYRDPATVNVLSVKDATGQTPLGLLFRRYRERVKMVIRTVDRLHRLHNPAKASLAAALTVNHDLGGLWERSAWMVARLAEHLECQGRETVVTTLQSWTSDEQMLTDSSEDKKPEASRRRFRILHASVRLIGYGCPPEMIRLAISLHPLQVREIDEDGNLPLHIAATASCYLTNGGTTEGSTIMAAAAAAKSDPTFANNDDLSVLSEALSFFSSATVSQTTNPFDKVIKMLLQHYPAGIKVTHARTGHTPLICALKAGERTWRDGLRTLVHAYPAALHFYRFDPSFYSHVLALVTTSHWQDWEGLGEDLQTSSTPQPMSKRRRRQQRAARTTLFELMRTKPDWLTK